MMDRYEYLSAYAKMRHGCIYEENRDIGFFRAEQLKRMDGVEHGFTARQGGVSPKPYDSLHLNFQKPHDLALVRENFSRFADAAGIEYSSMAMVSYEHGTNVIKLDADDAGRGFDKAPLDKCDGIVTDSPAVTLITNHADCGAFFIYDPVKKAVGLAHSGWKGTLGRIGANVVRLMQRCYGSDPKDMIASTGPAICKNCYEVDAPLAARFDAEFGAGVCTSPGREGHAWLDLEAAQAIQLIEAGLKCENITLMEKCTFEDEEHLFSHRRDTAKLGGTGDMAAYIRLV